MGNLNRREFLKKGAIAVAVTSTSLCSLGGCAAITKIGGTPAVNDESFTFIDNVLKIDLSKEPILNQVGGAIKIKHASIQDSLIIAHVEKNKFEIASLLCTHRGVEVEYDHEESNFNCASLGNSTFSLDGKLLSGPADEPLKEYAAVLENSVLSIQI
jgi:Rieske Fe-S protein